MRKLNAIVGNDTRRAYQVVTLGDLGLAWQPTLNYMVKADSRKDVLKVENLQARGVNNVTWISCPEIEEGDVVMPIPGRNVVDVSYRRSDAHHALFLTNRCNSNCLMCSQPPTKHDDGWLVDEAIDIIRHMPDSPRSLGITGGEPLLLGSGLRRVIDAIEVAHPNTRIDLLTNGRRLSNSDVAQIVLEGLSAKVNWLVPLYGHAHMLHDFVVQAPGAFEETLEGLLRLQAHGQLIQLRIVLIEPVLEYLATLCGFIGRNLPFVREVALMACEPIGFALANREMCEVDLKEWESELLSASKTLRRHGVRHVFMNAPLCSLPEDLWQFAHRSISDWKQVYAPECDGCAVRSSCSGLFAWHERGWKPTKITKIEEELL